jgi:phage-related holin
MTEFLEYLRKHLTAHPAFTGALAVISQVFPLSQVQLYAIGFLILVDTLTGMAAARSRGEVVRSRKARQMTLSKTMAHMVMVFSASVTVPLFDTHIILTGVIGMIASWELLSILENLQDLGVIKEENAKILVGLLKSAQGKAGLIAGAATVLGSAGDDKDTPEAPQAEGGAQ